MVIQENLMTAEEFAAMPDDGKEYDLVRGLLVEKNSEIPGEKPLHNVVASLIAHFLIGHIRPNNLGVVAVKLGCVLSSDPATIRFADVGFLSRRRLAEPNLDDYFPIAPDLVAEIVSPGDRASEILEKVEEYFQAGTQLMWVVYPAKRKVFSYTSPTTVVILNLEDTLDGGDVLPGFKLALRDLFKGLTQE